MTTNNNGERAIARAEGAMDGTAYKAECVRIYEANTTGSDEWFRHGLARNFLYTSGIAYVAETCGAYWLIDVAASYQHKPAMRAEPFQVWRVLDDRKGGVVVEAWNDTPGHADSKRLVRQEIHFSDFPRELCTDGGWQFYVENGTAMLRGER